MIGENEKHEKMREYSRVDAFLPVKVRLVPPEERETVWSRSSSETMSVDFPPLPDLEDALLHECLKTINSKLDAILHLLTSQNRETCLQPSHVNISGSGMSLTTKEGYALRDVLEIKLSLPTSGEDVFYVYGEVVKSEEESRQQHTTSIRFTVIDEDIRDQIVKFVFEKQREDLRKKKRE
jgi:hypothetical protein